MGIPNGYCLKLFHSLYVAWSKCFAIEILIFSNLLFPLILNDHFSTSLCIIRSDDILMSVLFILYCDIINLRWPILVLQKISRNLNYSVSFWLLALDQTNTLINCLQNQYSSCLIQRRNYSKLPIKRHIYFDEKLLPHWQDKNNSECFFILCWYIVIFVCCH